MSKSRKKAETELNTQETRVETVEDTTQAETVENENKAQKNESKIQTIPVYDTKLNKFYFIEEKDFDKSIHKHV